MVGKRLFYAVLAVYLSFRVKDCEAINFGNRWLEKKLYSQVTRVSSSFNPFVDNAYAGSYWNYPGGTITGGALTFDNTASMLFNGSGSYINFGDQDPSVNFTAFCWARQTTATTNLAIFSKWSASTGERSWVIQAGSADATKFSVLLSGGGGSVSKSYQSTTTLMSTTTFHQVGFTFVGGTDTLTLYGDGSASTNPTKTTDNTVGGALNSNTAAVAQGVVIKNGAGSIASFWAGYITHCAEFTVALSAAEFSATYNAGAPADLNAHSQVANLRQWYQDGNLTDTTTTTFNRGTAGSSDGTNTSITISSTHP